MGKQPFDVLVVGGGIHGAGSARVHAGRGWRVQPAGHDDRPESRSEAAPLTRVWGAKIWGAKITTLRKHQPATQRRSVADWMAAAQHRATACG